MSNDELARLWKLQAMVNKMVLDGKRTPEEVADALQRIVGEKSKHLTLLTPHHTLTVGPLTKPFNPHGSLNHLWLSEQFTRRVLPAAKKVGKPKR